MTNEITISSISEFISSISSKNKELKEGFHCHSYELLFRGQSDKNYKLIPSLGRNRLSSCDWTLLNEERNLIDMAKYKMSDIFNNNLLPIELLALLQHHGIPTRLLDLTENALVALYFACCDNKEKDGEIIAFKSINDDVTNYPVINAIADSYRFCDSTWTHLSLFYGNVKRQPYFLEQQQTIELCHKDDCSGGKWITECCDKILYIHAPIQSMRQRAQQGRYILFPNHIDKDYNDGEGCFEKIIKEIPKDHEDIEMRIIIPKEIKNQIMMDLSILGVTKSSLFCDNIDTICEGIVKSFKKRCNDRE